MAEKQSKDAVAPPRKPVAQASRRRLLKGVALTAPAVFTLPSDAAALAFGSFAQCVRNMTAEPERLHIGGTDNFARRRIGGIHIHKVIDDPLKTSYDPYDQDVHVLVRYNDPSLWIDERGQRWTEYSGYYYNRAGEKYQPFDRGDRYTVAFVDDNGQVLGVHPKYKSYGGRAVTGSCWISLLPKG